MKSLWAVLFQLAYPMCAFSSEINVWFGESGALPYAPDATAVQHSTINAAVMGQLFEVDGNNQIVAKVLDRFTYDQKQKSFILELPKGLQFHNGRLVTAEDLKFSLLRGLFSSKKNFYLLYLKEILGVSASKSYSSIDDLMNDETVQVKVLDSRRIAITLIKDNPNFIYMFCKGYFHLVPRESLDSDLFTWKKYPVGVGPYKISQVNQKEGLIVLEIFDPRKYLSAPNKINYFFGKMPVDVKLDVLPFEEIGANHSSEFELYEYQNIESISMFMSNNSNALGRNEDFRRLIYGLIDREAISSQLKGTLPAYENLPRVFGGNLEKKIVDREILKKKYSSIFNGLKKSGLRILSFTPSSGVKVLKPIIIRMFKDYGIKVEFIESKGKFLTKADSEQSPLELAGKIVDFFDPRFLFVSLLNASPFVYQRSLDKHLDVLNEEIISEENREKRQVLIRQMSEYVAEKAYEIPILEKKRILGFRHSSIGSLGLQTQPLILKFENVKTVSQL